MSGEFRRLGARLYAIAHQGREELADLQEELGTGITLLADPEGKAIVAFGMLDPSPFPPRPMSRAVWAVFGPIQAITGSLGRFRASIPEFWHWVKKFITVEPLVKVITSTPFRSSASPLGSGSAKTV